ncbi:hypothetical protein PNEG_00913 [Pneumocystis murina B123]|uniref:Uncharacterized protein n=1 Tax=Pneumocystis murina (strain B123) TaxID=1069680 RepID=M7PK09_PNEMU|nr:hypothetical protein PNEG_00913 [Pneumocystis murina B123]EMR10764.1 hypothetical protein PNEG_00913 [Pneumocystis murina B123]
MLSKPFSDPVLSLVSNSIEKLSILDLENLSRIWTVFAKSAENLENGYRLENLSWRLWYRTAFFCKENALSYINEADNDDSDKSIEYSKNKNFDIPELSTSIDSASTLDEHEIKHIPNYNTSKIPAFVQSRLKRPNTMQYVSPGRFQKIISDLSLFKLETEKWKNGNNKMVSKHDSREIRISDSPKENKIDYVSSKDSQSFTQSIEFSSNMHQSLTSNIDSIFPNEECLNLIERVGDIHEFSTNKISHETHVPHHSIQASKHLEKTDKIFFIQETLPAESYIETLSKNDFKSNALKLSSKSSFKPKSTKRISFEKLPSASSFETSNNEQFKYNIYNSIDNDDDNDWDSIYGSSSSSVTNEKPIFQKIDTRLLQLQLNPQRSLLSFMLQNKANGDLTNSCSKSSPAIALSQTSISFSISRQIPQNIQYHATRIEDQYSSMVSPRTIRRNMFATELSESLRKNLLWERQQRALTAYATLKRRHTEYDVTKLNGFPDRSNGGNYDFFYDVNYSYHVAGW